MGEQLPGGADSAPGSRCSSKNGVTTIVRGGVAVAKKEEIPCQRTEDILRHINVLLSDDTEGMDDSINALEKYGEDAATLIVDTLIKKSSQPHIYSNLTAALEGIGKASVSSLIHALGHINDVKRPEDVYLIVSIVETLGRLKDKRSVVPLLEQLEKLNVRIRNNHNNILTDICEAAKIRIHSVLSELDAKDGLADLLTMLGDGRRRIREGVIDSIAKIGDRRALLPLLRLYETETGISSAGAHRMKEVFRDIVRRENILQDDKLFKPCSDIERQTLDKLYPKQRMQGNGNGSSNGNGHNTSKQLP